MAAPSKITKLESLSYDELFDVFKKVLELKGYSNVTREEDYVVKGEKTSLLSVTTDVFITFPFRLGGTLDKDSHRLSDNICGIKDKYAADSVFVFSKNNITAGFKNNINAQIPQLHINYIGRDDIINLIDDVFSEYWRHEDLKLIQYENDFISNSKLDSDWKRLRFPNERYDKLLNIFIEPRLVRYYQDPKTSTPLSKNYTVSELIEYQESVVIDGSAGAGKTTLLKKIGELLIEKNTSELSKKHLPIYVSAVDIYDSHFDIFLAISQKVETISEGSLRELQEEYDIQVLIDSIDEFDEMHSRKIITDLNKITHDYKIKYYIASRCADNIINYSETKVSIFSIRRFNISQIKLFLDAFFSGDDGKTSTLLDALRNNQMVDRLPMTPLTLSLISILFEETDFEIPATISDIYDNFNTLIIGKAVVSSKIEFIDISFKERILSIYALKLLSTPNHIPLKKAEMRSYFKDYFEGKSLPIRNGSLDDVLEYLIHNTGILYVKDGERVQFTHDSYMEYYAALEIFKHKREEEKALVEHFLDPNWQNAAIFYAGESKDMPVFLSKIIDKVRASKSITDYMSGIFGIGYLLQALYQTDNQLRKEAIIEALLLSLKNLRAFEIMAADEYHLFKDYKLPILTLINFIYFYESFNSITLATPLRMAFEDRYHDYENSSKSDTSIGYNLLELAFTLDSKRIKDQYALQIAIDTPEILKDPNLSLFASISLDLLGKERYKDFILEVKKKMHSLNSVQRKLIEEPVSRLRFTAYDSIKCPSNVTLLVEGKTDAQILEYAFLSLTNASLPYWNIEKSGRNEEKGSCEEVKKTLEQSYALWKTEPCSVIIGIFDHDNAGLGSYRGLCKDFHEIEKDSIKKHNDGEIYALCLPIPGEMSQYIQERQEFNFFGVEHYFGHNYLKRAGVLKETELNNIYVIKGKKMTFAQNIRKEIDPTIFEHFLLLFKKIDQITHVDVDYIL